jgi:ribonuclease T2
LLALVAAAPASAQERRGGPPGDFDFYVLALSWSPSFCEGAGAERGSQQCEPGAGRGFVVHGLWPQFDRGFPSECGLASRAPSRIAMDGARGVFPDEGLARYEWRKHGTCSGLSPTDYFSAVRRARDAVAIPKPFVGPKSPQRWAVLDLERAFMAANPGLRADQISVACKGGALQEVRVCFTKDLRGFQTCPQVDRGACRAREISVPPPS